MNIIFIADYFVEHILGGGELNNEELITMLSAKGHTVKKYQSQVITPQFLKANLNNFFIVSNFVNLSFKAREILTQKCRYIIYEHDHKYLSKRDPAKYKDFKAPQTDIVNFYFYKNAQAVLCQSKFHKDIIEKNLHLDNIINVGGNLWSLKSLEKMRSFSEQPKNDKCSILNSPIPHKNTEGAIQYANAKKINYELIANSNYDQFLESLGKNKKFLFLPKTPETLSRVIVEARMMGCSVLTNNLVGAASEDWFKIKGSELIDLMTNKRDEIHSIVEKCLQFKRKQENPPLVSIVTTFHEADEYLEDYMKNITEQSMFKQSELIILDAASPGNEQTTINKYLKKYPNIIYKRFSERLSITSCLNKGIKLSKGKYLTFGFVDDVKRKDCIEVLYKNIIKNPDISLVYGDVFMTEQPHESYESNSSDGKMFEHSRYEFSKENMVKCLPGPMPLWDRIIHESCGFFDEENCNFADDWDMWLRAVSIGHKFKKVNEVVGLYFAGGRSRQDNNLEQLKEEAQIFFKYRNIFGRRFEEYKTYFMQFLTGENNSEQRQKISSNSIRVG
jgi:GT2 family glycosyltransferase